MRKGVERVNDMYIVPQSSQRIHPVARSSGFTAQIQYPHVPFSLAGVRQGWRRNHEE